LFTQEDKVSAQILSKSDAPMLMNYSPRSVGSDGNCMYRAVSLALFGSEINHEYVRFRTAIQILSNRNLYDVDSDEFVLQNKPMLTSPYKDIVQAVLKRGSDAEFVHLVALSAALAVTIQCYSCPLSFAAYSLHPYTNTILNNMCIHGMQSGHLSLMWTKTQINSQDPNHFVLLVPRCALSKISNSSSGLNLRSRTAKLVIASKPPQPSSATFQPPSAASISKPLSLATAADHPCKQPKASADILPVNISSNMQPIHESTRLSTEARLSDVHLNSPVDNTTSTPPLANVVSFDQRGRQPRRSPLASTRTSARSSQPPNKRVRQSRRSPTSQPLASTTSTPPLANAASLSPSTQNNTFATLSHVVRRASRSQRPPSTLINSGWTSPPVSQCRSLSPMVCPVNVASPFPASQPQNQPSSATDQSFEVDTTFAEPMPIDEDSIDIDNNFLNGILDDEPTDEPEFRIIQGASQRGKDLLVEASGFSYGVGKR
jgi:OTU-like cysteine protease